MDGNQVFGDEVTLLRGGVLDLTQRISDEHRRNESDFEMIDALQTAANSLGVVQRLLARPPDRSRPLQPAPVSASARLARAREYPPPRRP